jgi:hypothetical protein
MQEEDGEERDVHATIAQRGFGEWLLRFDEVSQCLVLEQWKARRATETEGLGSRMTTVRLHGQPTGRSHGQSLEKQSGQIRAQWRVESGEW